MNTKISSTELKKKQTELKNTMTEIKKYIEGINIRLDDTKQQISELEDRVVEITQAEEDKEFFKNEDSLGFPSSPVVKTPCFQCRGHGFDPWSGK